MLKPVRSLAILLACALLAACSQTTPPTRANLYVTNQFPAVDATNVPVDTAVMVGFDGDLDEGSLLQPIVLSSESGAVSGEFFYDTDSRTLMLMPEAELANDTEYTATVAESIRGVAGAVLDGAVSWSFTTEPAATGGGDGDGDGDGEGEPAPGDQIPDDEGPTDEDGDDQSGNPYVPPRDETEIVLPGVLSVSPKPWTYASRGTSVDITFEGDFAAGALEEGVNVRVFEFWRGLLYAISKGKLNFGSEKGVMSEDGNVATFTPNGNLKADKYYWIFLNIDVEDEHDNLLEGHANWLFKTLSN